MKESGTHCFWDLETFGNVWKPLQTIGNICFQDLETDVICRDRDALPVFLGCYLDDKNLLRLVKTPKQPGICAIGVQTSVPQHPIASAPSSPAITHDHKRSQSFSSSGTLGCLRAWQFPLNFLASDSAHLHYPSRLLPRRFVGQS